LRASLLEPSSELLSPYVMTTSPSLSGISFSDDNAAICVSFGCLDLWIYGFGLIVNLDFRLGRMILKCSLSVGMVMVEFGTV
jgi:hypothetical protein